MRTFIQISIGAHFIPIDAHLIVSILKLQKVHFRCHAYEYNF